MNKKILLMVVAMLLVVGLLVGCATSAPAASSAPAESSAAVASSVAPAPASSVAEASVAASAAASSAAPATSYATTYKIADVCPDMTNQSQAFSAKMFQKHAADYGLTVTIMDGKGDPATQAQCVTTAIAQGAKAILVNPNDINAIVPSLMAAKQAGVVVCMFSSDLAAANQQYRDFYVGANDEIAGQNVAQMFIKQFPNGANIVEVGGQAGHDAAIKRHDGFTTALKGSNINVIDFQNTKTWDTNQAMNIMQDFIVKDGSKIQGVFCHWDGGMTGVIQAEIAAKVDPASLYQVGIDGSKAGFDQVKAGQESVSIMQNFETMASTAMKLVREKLDGQTVQPINYITWDIVTKDTIANFTYPEW